VAYTLLRGGRPRRSQSAAVGADLRRSSPRRGRAEPAGGGRGLGARCAAWRTGRSRPSAEMKGLPAPARAVYPPVYSGPDVAYCGGNRHVPSRHLPHLPQSHVPGLRHARRAGAGRSAPVAAVHLRPHPESPVRRLARVAATALRPFLSGDLGSRRRLPGTAAAVSRSVRRAGRPAPASCLAGPPGPRHLARRPPRPAKLGADPPR